MNKMSYIAELPWNNHKEFMNSFKENLGNWAKKYGDQYSDFGKTIKIESVVQIPTHVVQFDTMYEHRKKYFTTAHLNSQTQPTSKRTIFKLSEINRWDYNMKSIPEDWNSLNYSIYVSGSDYIDTCDTCDGDGRVSCHVCHGKGKHNCYDCKGDGEVKCSSCHGSGSNRCTSCNGRGNIGSTTSCSRCGGSGHVTVSGYSDTSKGWTTCSKCGGRGKIDNTQRCTSCSGSGKISCSTCIGKGKVTCKTCNGSGIVQCEKCHGEGTVICKHCNGKGKIVKYIKIEQKYIPLTRAWYYHYPNLLDHYPDFDFDHNKTTGFVIHSVSDKKLPADFNAIEFDETELTKKDFREDLKNLLDTVNAECPEGELDSTTYIRAQNFTLLQYDVFEVEYSYEGKKYYALVWGKNREFVYTKTSPFREKSYAYSQEAQKYFNKKQYGTAVKYLEKSIQLCDDKEVIKEMEQTIGDIKSYYFKTYIKAMNLALIIGIPIFMIIIYFFIDKIANFSNPDMQEYVRSFDEYSLYIKIMLLILYIAAIKILNTVIKRFFRKPGKKPLHSDSLRWKIGLIGGILTSAISFFLVKLFYQTGLPAFMMEILNDIAQRG
ncbi:MAG: hypothetical protein ACLFQM_07155 [Fidelibacterota bacterium]